jgi:response regulator RpfG family c-di-GMP phosphodiesterase
MSERAEILLVDDEPHVLEALEDLLVHDFDVVTAASGEEAVAILEARDVAVVVADQRMPRMSGSALLVRAAQVRPDATRILLTGYSDLEAVVHAINEGSIYHYAIKPWDPDDLLEVLRRAVERHELIVENRRLVGELAAPSPEMDARAVLGQRASGVESALLKRDNERLRRVLDDFSNAFWHLRKLQEVLPLCMGCGRVRDEQGRWVALPAFLQRNGAFLSHGYCPPCEAMLDDDGSPKAK